MVVSFMADEEAEALERFKLAGLVLKLSGQVG